MGKKKTKLEKEEPEQVMPNEQLFFSDKAGHESVMIRKMREKAGKPSLSSSSSGDAVEDGSYDDFVPKPSKKQLQKQSRLAAQEKALQVQENPDVQNYSSGKEPKVGMKRKYWPTEIKNDKIRDIWTEEAVEVNPIQKNGLPTYDTGKVPRKFKHDRKPNQVHILQGIPLPGDMLSYNPTPEAHQQAVLKAATAIVKESQEAARINKAVGAVMNRLNRLPVDQLLAAPVVLDEDDEDSNDASTLSSSVAATASSTIADAEAAAAPKVPIQAENRLTTLEKNQRARKEAEQKLQEKKKQAKQISAQIDEVDKIHAELLEDEQKKAEEREQIQQLKKHKPNKTPRLGKLPFAPLTPRALLAEDLPGSMRLVKQASAAVAEQFNNLQRRNLIEPRKKNNYKRRYEKQVLKRKDDQE